MGRGTLGYATVHLTSSLDGEVRHSDILQLSPSQYALERLCKWHFGGAPFVRFTLKLSPPWATWYLHHCWCISGGLAAEK